MLRVKFIHNLWNVDFEHLDSQWMNTMAKLYSFHSCILLGNLKRLAANNGKDIIKISTTLLSRIHVTNSLCFFLALPWSWRRINSKVREAPDGGINDKERKAYSLCVQRSWTGTVTCQPIGRVKVGPTEGLRSGHRDGNRSDFNGPISNLTHWQPYVSVHRKAFHRSIGRLTQN